MPQMDYIRRIFFLVVIVRLDLSYCFWMNTLCIFVCPSISAASRFLLNALNDRISWHLGLHKLNSHYFLDNVIHRMAVVCVRMRFSPFRKISNHYSISVDCDQLPFHSIRSRIKFIDKQIISSRAGWGGGGEEGHFQLIVLSFSFRFVPFPIRFGKRRHNCWTLDRNWKWPRW